MLLREPLTDNLTLTEIQAGDGDKLFLEAGYALYKNDSHFIRPFDHDVLEVFDLKKNKLFRSGAKARRWVLLNNRHQPVGRIAAFVNPRYLFTGGYKSGGLGFFECINDQQAANRLFDVAVNWLRDEGMQVVDGPINLGERDKWWGCLSDGFNDSPTYRMNYNPPYYNDLFTNYGFQTYFEQLVYEYKVDEPVPERFYEKARRIEANPRFTFDHFRKSQLDKYAEALVTVYNAAWGKHEHFKLMKKEQAIKSFKVLLPVMDEKLIWFGYYDGAPIAFFIMVPDFNQVVKKLNGKLGWWEKVLFKIYLMTGTVDRIQGILFGVVPAHQSKGVEGATIIAAAKVVQPLKRYRTLEMTWIGDFNPKMIHMVENLGANVVKRYKTYRLMLQPGLEFRRAAVVD